MKKKLMDSAYALARQHYEAAALSAFSDLDSQFEDEGFDAIFHATQRAKKLYLSASDFAERIWDGNIPYEKAKNALQSQFSDFPEETVERAFSDAYVKAK